jgi:hypothetical protein
LKAPLAGNKTLQDPDEEMAGADLPDGRSLSKLYYHFHVPRTAGTTVANLLVADICQPYSEKFDFVGWESFCTLPCEAGLVDCELSCYPDDIEGRGRWEIEHSVFALHQPRADDLLRLTGAKSVVFVTALRHGSDRVVSQWLKESYHGSWVPPHDVPKLSNESLQLFLKIPGKVAGGGWIAGDSTAVRNNLQVASLASLDLVDPEQTVTEDDLELAKQVLMMGEWVIGFKDCVEQLHEKLEQIAFLAHGRSISHKKLTSVHPEGSYEGTFYPDRRSFNQETLDLLNAAASFDNKLYEWAWEEADKQEDGRWAGTCELPD